MSFYLACYSGSTVHWLIKKQPITATSTIEAEFIAISHAIDEVLWIKRIVEELGMEKSLVIKLDSLEAIENVKNGPTSKMKKLDLRRWHGLENLEIFHQALNLARKVADRAAHVQDIGLPATLVNMRERQVRNRH